MSALLLKRFSSFLSSSHSHHPLLTPLLRLTLSTKSQSQSQKEEETPFIANYLISSFGFSLDRALRYSANRNLAPIKSTDRPVSVICFLKDAGMSDSQIKAVISFNPTILSYSVDKTLKPRALQLLSAGVSEEIVVQLIRYNPTLLSLKDPVLQLQFWREFVGNDDKALLRVIRGNPLLFRCNIERYVVPRLNLYREYGLSNRQIALLVTRSSGLVFRSLDYLRRVIEQTQKLGFQPGTGMFLEGLIAVGSNKENSFNRKIMFFKMSYGWSDDEVYSAIKKHPRMLTYSEEGLRSHMDFLITKAMLDPRSIASRPKLLGFSIEKRLVPRYHVLNILRALGLKKKCKLCTVFNLSEKIFLEKFVVLHEKDVPGLGEAYAAACSGNVLPEQFLIFGRDVN